MKMTKSTAVGFGDDIAYSCPDFTVRDVLGLPPYWRNPVSLTRITDKATATKQRANRCDLLEIDIQKELIRQRLEVVRQRLEIVTLSHTSDLPEEQYLKISKERAELGKEQREETFLLSQLNSVTEVEKVTELSKVETLLSKVESLVDDTVTTNSLTEVECDRTQEKPSKKIIDPINQYFPRGSAKGGPYYRLSYREGNRVRHCHIPGGAVGCPLVEMRVNRIKEMLAQRYPFPDILAYIRKKSPRAKQEAA
jgi:hypothetical protein